MLDKECFVCYDTCDVIQLCSHTKCACNGWVHEACLDRWCSVHNTCPMCRQPLNKDKDKNKEYISFSLFYSLYKIISIVKYCLFTYIVIELYICISNKSHL